MVEFILFIALFFPRIALLLGYFTDGILPNPFPFIMDAILWVIVPRLLIIFYLLVNYHTFDHVVFWLLMHSIGLIMSIFWRYYDYD